MRLLSALLVVSSLAPLGLPAQRADSVFPHSTLVVTAQRSIAPIHSSVNAITRLDQSLLSKRPVRTLAEALQQAPGIAFVDFEGTGADPQAMVRGFYGGGESEYLLLLVNGEPINNLESGRITWDLFPLGNIQSVELVRGPASEVWGDAAIGGVINVITQQPMNRWSGAFTGGGFGWRRASVSASPSLGSNVLNLTGNYSASEGFREHADRASGGIGASIRLSGTAERGIVLSTMHDRREYEEPGAILSGESIGRDESSPFHRFDQTEDRLHRVSLNAVSGIGRASLRTSLTGELRNSGRIRTLRLAPEFADTKERDLSTRRVIGSGVFERRFGSGTALIGLDASYSSLDSDYFLFASGPAVAYTSGTSARGELDSHAEGNRLAGAGFARVAIELLPGLTASAGTRVDGLRDSFETDATAEKQTESRTVASHRGGLNYAYAASDRQRGSLYVTVSQSFKAATPDQLYDRRKIPVPFPPFAITFASPTLEPQRGVNYEAGLYHDATIGSVQADLNVAAYQMDLKDEIDFDVATLSYGNIGRTRHRGIEAGLNLSRSAFGLFTNYALQSATFRSGDNSGNHLKAIPRHYVVTGLSAGTSGLLATVMLTSANRMFLDDANEQTIADWKRWDLRASYGRGEFQVTADLINLADTNYNTTGFADPSGSGAAYYYPAAGRSLHIGLNWRR